MYFSEELKIKPTFFDRIFRKNKFSEIIELRSDIESMLKIYMELSSYERIFKYNNIWYLIDTKYLCTSLNEVKMFSERGEKAVINRLRYDRDYIYDLLKEIPELDLSHIKNKIRMEKINDVVK